MENFEPNPFRRNLVVICLVILLYILGEGQFLDSGVRLGWFGFELKNPVVIEYAAILILAWCAYRYECFGGLVGWHVVNARMGRLAKEDEDIKAVVAVLLRSHGNGPGEQVGSYLNIEDVHFLTGNSFWSQKLGPVWILIWEPWVISQVAYSLRSSITQTFTYRLDWYYSRFIKVRLMIRAIFGTEYLPSVVMPYMLLFTTLLVLLLPKWASFYTEYGVLVTLGITLLPCLLFYWRDIQECIRHLKQRRQTHGDAISA